MTVSGHVVYLGTDPESVLGFVRGDSALEDVTVTVAGSPDAALRSARSPRTDCLIVDEQFPGGDLDSFLQRLETEVPGMDVLVRVAADEADGPDIEAPVNPGILWADSPPEQRWQRLADRLRSTDEDAAGDGPTDTSGVPGTFTDTLQWHQPGDDRVRSGGLTDFLENTPMVVDTFLDNILDIFFVFDMDLNFRLWNDRFNEVTGYTDEEIAASGPLEFIIEDHHERALDRIEEILATGQATAEFGLRTRDGDPIPYSFTGSLIQDDEAGTFISGIGRDISDRKARERELRRERDLTNQIIETSPMAILVIDDDGTILRANSRATKVLGLTESDTAMYAVDGDWGLYDEHGDEVPVDDHPVVRALRRGETVYGYRHLVEMPDGEEKWLSTNVAPLTDEAGYVAKVVVAIEDITELKEHEQELARRKVELDEAVAELKRSNTELERFAYVASHDLKEPLRMISNYLGLLERRYGDELDEDAHDFIDYATDGAERMRGLINGLLKYSRTQRHDDPLEPVDSAAVVETVRSNLSVAIDETGAEITTDSLPTVIGDRNHLVQLFQNLVSNAITYSGDGPPRIDISVEREGDRYRFAVADDGRGIDVDETDRVFDIFYSGDESDSTGIGLAICQKIVENHGGRIWAESRPGEGTTVYFTLAAENAAESEYSRSISPTGS